MAFEHVNVLTEARKQVMSGGAEEKRRQLVAARWKLAGRVSLGVAVILILLAIRQLYFGGTIPFIREPEKFRVDTKGESPKAIRD